MKKQKENILKKEELYYPQVKRYENLENKFFINSTLLKSYLVKYLDIDFLMYNKIEGSKIFFIISNKN